AGHACARRERVAEQQATAAADLEQAVAGTERERVEDRAARPIVNILRTVGRTRTRARRLPRDAVGQPVDERVLAEPGRNPGVPVLVAEPELRQRGARVAQCIVSSSTASVPMRRGSFSMAPSFATASS